MKNLHIKPQISIIIVSYNCWDYLKDCLKSLALINVPYEAIVVDNASGDETVLNLKQQFPEVKTIVNDYNAGFSRANNQGFTIASGEVVLFLNPDAQLLNDHLLKAFGYLKQNPRTIIGAALLNSDGTDQDSVFEVSGVKQIFMEAVFLSYLLKKTTNEILAEDAFGLSGACLLMNASTYSELKGFDNNLFWMEDIDLCVRARSLAIQIKYFPEWQVLHHVGQSGKKNYKVSIANQLMSKLKYLKKHGNSYQFAGAAFLVQIHIFLRCVLFGTLSPLRKVYRLKFFAYWHTQSLFFSYIFTRQTQFL